MATQNDTNKKKDRVTQMAPRLFLLPMFEVYGILFSEGVIVLAV